MSVFEEILGESHMKHVKRDIEDLPEQEVEIEKPEAEKMLEKVPLEKVEKSIEGNASLERLYKMLLRDAIKYCYAKFDHIRLAHNKVAQVHNLEGYKERLQRLDELRRINHKSLIDSLNILSRNCAKHKRDNSWRDPIGWESNSITRERLAAWAMGVAFEIYEEVKQKEEQDETKSA